jgi:glycolate oxidase iron-sulfur subunit
MQHTLPLDQLGPAGPDMAHAIEKCVHCGFCLPTCPTYVTLGEEMDSPRGRIFLMKSALEGAVTVEETLPFVDKCLGCMACVTACPAGVPYADLLTPYRARAETQRARPLMEQLTRRLVRETLPYPDRFRWAARTGPLARAVRPLLPSALAEMVALLPDAVPPAGQPLPRLYPAQGKRRARVALLAGCVQQVLAPNINWATLRVLAHNGVEVIIPGGQGCCGSLLMHTGEAEAARALARKNLAAFPDVLLRDVDAVITNAAGCGSGMKEYGLLFKGQAEAELATDFARRVRDVSEFLAELEIESPPESPPIKIAYHDACHLAHTQRITEAPRQLLRAIPGVTLVEIAEGELCCGSAGTYNLEQPALAHQIGQRKAQNILRTRAEAVVTGNIGCMVQLRTHLQKLGQPLPIWHTLEALDRAYRGERLV